MLKTRRYDTMGFSIHVNTLSLGGFAARTSHMVARLYMVFGVKLTCPKVCLAWQSEATFLEVSDKESSNTLL